MSAEGPAWPPEEWDVVESETKGCEMSAERDELERIIDDRWHGYGYNPQGAAAAILAAGYSKPRTIATVAELDELPVGTVVIDGSGAGEVYRKLARADGIKWYEPSYAIHWESHELKLPAIVIWDPRP